MPDELTAENFPARLAACRALMDAENVSAALDCGRSLWGDARGKPGLDLSEVTRFNLTAQCLSMPGEAPAEKYQCLASVLDLQDRRLMRALEALREAMITECTARASADLEAGQRCLATAAISGDPVVRRVLSSVRRKILARGGRELTDLLNQTADALDPSERNLFRRDPSFAPTLDIDRAVNRQLVSALHAYFQRQGQRWKKESEEYRRKVARERSDAEAARREVERQARTAAWATGGTATAGEDRETLACVRMCAPYLNCRGACRLAVQPQGQPDEGCLERCESLSGDACRDCLSRSADRVLGGGAR